MQLTGALRAKNSSIKNIGQSGVYRSDITPFDGTAELSMYAAALTPQTQVSVVIYDADANLVEVATGVVSAEVSLTGSSKFQPFDTQINLGTDSWTFSPQIAACSGFKMSIAALDEDLFFQISVGVY